MAEKTIKFNDILNKGISEFINPKPKTIKVEDNRKVSPTTGKPIPKSNNTIYANKELLKAIIAHAKANGIKPETALSIAYQESKFGYTDDNIGHNLLMPSQQFLDNDETQQYKTKTDKDAAILVDGIKQKFDYATKLGKTNLVDSLQTYNGLGKLSPSTESKYYKGVQQNSFYGVPVTKDNPIDLSKNPLYGKAVKSIQDSVINTNLDIQSLIKNTQPFNMKKKLGGKIKIPKYAPGGYMTTGDTVQLADSNMLQGYDSGLSSIPDYSAAQESNGNSMQIMQGIGQGMGAVSEMIPERGKQTAAMSRANQMKEGVAKSGVPFASWFAGADLMVTKAFGGGKTGETVGGIMNPLFQGIANMNNKNLTAGQKFLNFLPGGNLANPDFDARFDKQFETKNVGSNLNFGNATQEIDNSTILKAALGGLVNSSSKDFKQFNADTHEEGGQFIDKNKNPTNDQNKAVAEIEKKENSYKDYIFSDTLLHKNEITFAKQADKINRKYKDREDVISKNSLDIELTELMKKNEKQRQLAEEQNQNLLAQVQEFALGGMLNKRRNVNSFNDMMDNSFYSPDGKFFTDQQQYQNYQNLYYPQENVPNLNPIINNYGKIKFKKNNFQFKNGGVIPKAKLGLPTDPDYFTQLMQQQGVIDNNVVVPPPNMSFAYPEERPTVNTSDITKDVNIPEMSAYNQDLNLDVNNKTKTKNKPSWLEMAGYGIKGAELLGHAIQAFKKPELVNPVYNPEENAIKNIMKNRSVDVQSILNELDLQEAGAKQNIANNSTSVGVMQANLQKLNAKNVNAITKTKFDEQLQNNQYRAAEADVLNNLGQQKVVAQNYAEDLNARAKGNVQNQRDKFLKESIGGLGDFLLKKDYVNKDNEFQMNILKSKGINFEPTDYKTWNKAGIDIVKFDAELESTTDTEKRKELIETTKQKFLKEGGTEEAWNRNIYALQNKQLKK